MKRKLLIFAGLYGLAMMVFGFGRLINDIMPAHCVEGCIAVEDACWAADPYPKDSKASWGHFNGCIRGEINCRESCTGKKSDLIHGQ